MSLESRISINPEIYHGKPCISGTRIPVHSILELIMEEYTFEEIIASYPQISKLDIKSCINFASNLILKKEITANVNIDATP